MQNSKDVNKIDKLLEQKAPVQRENNKLQAQNRKVKVKMTSYQRKNFQGLSENRKSLAQISQGLSKSNK